MSLRQIIVIKPSNPVKTPRFLYGDRLCWLSTQSDTDWGIVIGDFIALVAIAAVGVGAT